MEKQEFQNRQNLEIKKLKTKDWYAWNNLMPPPPDSFHTIGEVCVPNPGVQAMLYPREPQGINPNILMLDLFLWQESGVWTLGQTWKGLKYEKINQTYEVVEVHYNNEKIAEIEVVNIK